MSDALPFGAVRLAGWAKTRVVPLVLPTQSVLGLLPEGLRLRPQNISPAETHLVILSFHDIMNAKMTIPTPLPRIDYFECVVSIPFVSIRGNALREMPDMSFQYMPQLFVTNQLAMVGGRIWWGFAKDLARIVVTEQTYEIWSNDGRPLIALEYHPTTDVRPAMAFPHFATLRPVLDLPVASRLPFDVGDFWVASRFERDWATARMRSIAAEVHIVDPVVPGLPARRYPCSGASAGIHEQVLGAFEIMTQWSLAVACPPWMVN